MSSVNTIPQGHSPLGASGAKRWMACPGSVQLAVGDIEDQEDDTFSLPGQAAHTLAEECLAEGKETWMYLGHTIMVPSDRPGEDDRSVTVTVEMANAISLYLADIRRVHPRRPADCTWVEQRFHCPTLHRYYYGMSDFAYFDKATRTLHVWDLKYGAGIIIEVQQNEQIMYYAAGVLETLALWGDADKVVLHVHQPRGFHFAGPHRTWEVSTDDLWAWVSGELIPAMDRALVSRDTKSGEHCRFCPVRYRKCPQIERDINELEALMKELKEKGADALPNETIARIMTLAKVFKIALKAAEQTAFNRLQHGQAITGFKLAPARVNREWKEGAEAALVKALGEQAYQPKKLISPAQAEELPSTDTLIARWAYKPEAGLVVVEAGDPRTAVNREVKSMFQPVNKQRKGK